MKASEIPFLRFLQQQVRFVVPIYQRNYSWGESECIQLWNDIIKAGDNQNTHSYFIGTIVYIQNTHGNISSLEPLMLIDGQQRMTTISLLLSAIATIINTGEHTLSEDHEQFQYKKIINYYLFNHLEQGEKHYRLLPSKEDRETYKNVLNSVENTVPLTENDGTNTYENYEFFLNTLRKNLDKIETLLNGLVKLIAVDVCLERGRDNPQLIFESLNSTGRELTQFDLIRNYLLMDLEESEQNRLFDSYWSRIETIFTAAQENNHLDEFFANFLIINTQKKSRKNEIYENFKNFCLDKNNDREVILKEILEYSTYYANIYDNKEKNPELKKAFKNLNKLKTNACQPLVLFLYKKFCEKHFSHDEFLSTIKYIESYIFRRQICGLSSKKLSGVFLKVFDDLLKNICNPELNNIKNIVVSSLYAQENKNGFPSDNTFKDHIIRKNIYKMLNSFYILEKMENHNKKEIDLSNYQIEHILPQNLNLSLPWRNNLGEKYKDIQNKWVDTIGNLTLTQYNSEYKDYEFEYKLNKITNKNGENVGLKYDNLSLNNFFKKDLHSWGEKQIMERADILSSKALEIWPFPLENEISYLKIDEINQDAVEEEYNIHKYSIFGTKEYMDIYRRIKNRVLSISPGNVEENFFKNLISFKYIKSVLDVVPRTRGIDVYINLPYKDFKEQISLGRDVTDKGHLGSGDIHYKLATNDDNLDLKIDEIFALVNYSYLRQSS